MKIRKKLKKKIKNFQKKLKNSKFRKIFTMLSCKLLLNLTESRDLKLLAVNEKSFNASNNPVKLKFLITSQMCQMFGVYSDFLPVFLEHVCGYQHIQSVIYSSFDILFFFELFFFLKILLKLSKFLKKYKK